MPVEVGQEAPDFTLKNPANEDVTLSSFRGTKNVVLVVLPAGVQRRLHDGSSPRSASTSDRYAGERRAGARRLGGQPLRRRAPSPKEPRPDRHDPAGRLRAQGGGAAARTACTTTDRGFSGARHLRHRQARRRAGRLAPGRPRRDARRGGVLPDAGGLHRLRRLGGPPRAARRRPRCRRRAAGAASRSRRGARESTARKKASIASGPGGQVGRVGMGVEHRDDVDLGGQVGGAGAPAARRPPARVVDPLHQRVLEEDRMGGARASAARASGPEQYAGSGKRRLIGMRRRGARRRWR